MYIENLLGSAALVGKTAEWMANKTKFALMCSFETIAEFSLSLSVAGRRSNPDHRKLLSKRTL